MIWIVRANQYAEARLAWTNRAEDVETRTTGHLQIKNYSVWFQSLDTVNRFRYIACLSCELNARHIPEEVGEALDNYCRVIRDNNPHFPSPQGPFCTSLENDKSERKYIR